MPLDILDYKVIMFSNSNFNHRSVINTAIWIHILHLDEYIVHEITVRTQPKEYVEWIIIIFYFKTIGHSYKAIKFMP